MYVNRITEGEYSRTDYKRFKQAKRMLNKLDFDMTIQTRRKTAILKGLGITKVLSGSGWIPLKDCTPKQITKATRRLRKEIPKYLKEHKAEYQRNREAELEKICDGVQLEFNFEIPYIEPSL